MLCILILFSLSINTVISSRLSLTFLKRDCQSLTDLIFVTNMTNYIRGEKIVMWRNFSFPCMTIVGKLKISPHEEKFQYNWWGFIAIYAVLLLNLLFTLFCRKIFATIYALSCGGKLSPKVHLWRKNDKYEVWVRDVPLYRLCSFLNIVQKGGG